MSVAVIGLARSGDMYRTPFDDPGAQHELEAQHEAETGA